MDDLRTLASELAPDEPSQDVVDRSRHRLQNHVRGNHSVRRRTWLPIAAAITVAAAVAAVAIVVVPSTGTQAPASGQNVLLEAADAAERVPEGSGTYWHLKVEFPFLGLESWTKPNGEAWYRNSGTEYEIWPASGVLPSPFSLASGVDLTFDQLRALPTDPAALRTWVAEAVVAGSDRDTARASLASLVALVSTVPAPPDVRAAAFRVLAEYPGISNLGNVPGGQAVQLAGDVQLVVDVAAGRVNGTSALVVMGMRYVVTSGEKVTIIAEWTDSPPL